MTSARRIASFLSCAIATMPRYEKRSGAGLAVVIEQFPGLETGEERAEHVAALGDLADVLRAATGDPHRRVRLLIDARPDVDVAVLKMFALPVERPVDRGHRLDDQVVRFPEAVHLAD